MHDSLQGDPDYESERVQPYGWLEPCWRCFHELAGERSWTVQGLIAGLAGGLILSRPLPLRWTAIVAWLDRAGLDTGGIDFVRCVQAMDRVFVSHQAGLMQQALRNAVKAR